MVSETEIEVMEERKQLLELLEKHKPFDENEAQMLQEMIVFVKTNEDCFKRELLIGHVTGSAWIVDKTRNFVLLMHHKKLNRWFQPGGHCDGESDVLAVAIKEANEETGLVDIQPVSHHIFDIDIHLIPERKGVPAHYHYDVRFLFEADMNTPIEINEESNDVKWIDIEEVINYNNEESMRRMVKKIRGSK